MAQPTFAPIYLRQWRKHRRLTLIELGQLADMSPGFLSMLERGQRGYTQATLEALARALRTTPALLLTCPPVPAPLELSAPLPDYVPVTPPRRSFLARVAEWLFGGSKEAADV